MKTAAKHSVNAAFKALQLAAEKHYHVVYEIAIRRAGVGICYVKEDRVCQMTVKAVKDSQVVYTYYPTIAAAIDGEIEAWKKHVKGEERVR